MIGGTLLEPRGEELFEIFPHIQARLLRFGAFVTVRHPKMRTLAWYKPIGDTQMIDNMDSVIHCAIKPVADHDLLERRDKILSSTTIRQQNLAALTLAQVEDFLSPSGSLNSELPLELSTKTSQSRCAANIAVSGIGHLVYLTSADRRRFGLSGQLSFDLFIEQARTGLLTSTNTLV